MNYKNYRNSYTNEDKIYSRKNIADMSVREAFSRKDEIMAQYRSIGIPSEGELKSSPNVVWVESYTRDDETEVRAHWRSKPDGVVSNNFSHGNHTEGASNIDESKLNEQEDDSLNNNIKLEATITKEEQIKKMMYPDEIAGVKRGKPKTFEQMTQQVINPKLYSEEDVNGRYSNNCACCTVTGELIIRGYNVEAGPADTPIAKELGKAHISAYLEPKTGEECVPQKINIDEVDCFNYLDKNVKQGERYEFSYYTQRNLFYGESNENAYNNQKTQGHVVLITRNEKNELVWYDPQDGDGHKGTSDVKAFLNSWVNERTLFDPRILRIDDKALNPKYVNAVVRKRN